jgi:hypothetical protein
MRYPSNRRKCEYINGELYIVHAKYPQNRVKNVLGVKEWLGVDHVFKSHRDNTYVFCDLIECIEWEEII